MEPNKTEKDFDAVKMMREARAKISSDTQHMTFEELKVYIATQLSSSKAPVIGKK